MTISILDRAIALAVACHGGHMDKAGYPEIMHPLSVMGKLRYESDEIRAAAVLHDTVEDGYTTHDHIKDNFPARVAELVKILTRDKKVEQYFDYIKRIAVDSDACKIKRADIADNMERRSPPSLRGIHKKYKKALAILNGSTEPNELDGDGIKTFKLPPGAHEMLITYSAEHNLLYIKFTQANGRKIHTMCDVMGRSGLNVDLYYDDETCHGIEII